MMRTYISPARDYVTSALQSETDTCILWLFAVRASSGYGSFKDQGKTVDVHRYVCAQAHGEPEPGEEAAHLCGRKLCINPRHLRWGTRIENMGDTKKHGTLIGGGIYRQRLFAPQKAEIAASKDSLVTIAVRYGMEPSHIGRVRRKERQKWAA